MTEISEQITPEEAMLERLKWATEQTSMLERDLSLVRYERDDLILDLLGTKVSRKEISDAANLAEISIYKIAARVRERRKPLEPVEKKPRRRAKKADVPVQVEAVSAHTVIVTESRNQPVTVEVPAGSHPLLGWTLAAA